MSTHENDPALTPEEQPLEDSTVEVHEEDAAPPADQGVAEATASGAEKATRDVKTNWYPLALAMLLVAAIIVGVLFFTSRTAPTAEERVEQTRAYVEVSDAVALTPDAKPAQLLLAPATADWWEKVLRFGRDTAQLNRFKFDDYKAGAEYISFVLSPGSDFHQPSGFGLPTFMISYDTPEQAEAASDKLKGNQPSDEEGGAIKHYVRDGLLIFTPPGAVSDLDYPVESFEEGSAQVEASSEGEDLFADGTKAVWQFNFNEFRQIVLSSADEEGRQAYDTVMSSLNVTDAASFVGTSTDLLSWDGRFYDLNLAAVPNPETVLETLGNFYTYASRDGEGVTVKELEANPELEDELTGLALPSLADLILHTQISAHTQASGYLTSYVTGTSEEAEVLAPSEGLFRLKFSPNIWVGYLAGQGEEVSATYFSDITVTILDGEGNAKIDFSDFQEVIDQMPEPETPESPPAGDGFEE